MKVVFTDNAREDLQRRMTYTAEHFGHNATQKVFGRIDTFIHETLAHFPHIGRTHSSGLLETWIPRTPFFVIYRTETAADTLTILAMFHHAQDRTSFKEP
jgi:plasmid stabilization system protein ParE